MSRKELVKTMREFADECDKLAHVLKVEEDSERFFKKSPESKLGQIHILEAHRDWANNLIPKI